MKSIPLVLVNVDDLTLVLKDDALTGVIKRPLKVKQVGTRPGTKLINLGHPFFEPIRILPQLVESGQLQGDGAVKRLRCPAFGILRFDKAPIMLDVGAVMPVGLHLPLFVAESWLHEGNRTTAKAELERFQDVVQDGNLFMGE